MNDILDRTKIYIDGQWVDSDGSGRIEVVNPTTEEVVAVVAEGVASDVDRAVAAAKAAFAAATARSTSEAAPSATAATTSSVVGFTTSMRPAPSESTHCPSM